MVWVLLLSVGCDSHTSRRTLQVWSKLSCSQFQSILDSTGNTLSPSSALQGSTRDSDCAYFLGRSSRRRDAGTRCRVRARTEYGFGRKAILPSFWRVLIQTSVRGLPAGRKVPVCRNCPTGLSRVQPGESSASCHSTRPWLPGPGYRCGIGSQQADNTM